MQDIEKELIKEINKKILELGDLIINNDSLESKSIKELKEYENSIFKSYRSTEIIYLYIDNLIDKKISELNS